MALKAGVVYFAQPWPFQALPTIHYYANDLALRGRASGLYVLNKLLSPPWPAVCAQVIDEIPQHTCQLVPCI